MTVAFRLDAGHDIGMGHAFRCSALADELECLGCRCVFFCRENPEIQDFLVEKGFPLVSIPVLPPEDELFWMREALTGFSAVVIDSYWLSDSYIDGLNDPGRVVCCLDDNALYRYSCDLLLNGNLHAGELQYRFGKKKPRLLLGGGYCLLRREFRETDPIEIRERANRVFLCMGGTDARGFLPKALDALQGIPNVEIDVVLGPMTSSDSEVRRIAGKNVTVHKNPGMMSRIMSRCDMAVAAAGSMVYELGTMGIPSVLVVQADNQELIAAYLSRQKLMTVAGNYTMTDLSPLRDDCLSLLNDPERRRREHKALLTAVPRYETARAARAIKESVTLSCQKRSMKETVCGTSLH